MEAENRRNMLQDLVREDKIEALSYWEDYRRMKIDMIDNYMRILKTSKKLKVTVSMVIISQVTKKMKDRLL